MTATDLAEPLHTPQAPIRSRPIPARHPPRFLLALAMWAVGCGTGIIEDAILPPLLQTPPVVGNNIPLTAAPLFSTSPGRTGHHAAAVGVLGDGELVAAWYSYDGPHELDNAALYFARRPSAAHVWTAPEMITGLPMRVGNPVLYVEGDRIMLFFAHVPFGWSTASVWQTVSTDRGSSWHAPTQLNGPLGANVRNPPIRLDDGALLLPAYSDFWLNGFFFR